MSAYQGYLLNNKISGKQDTLSDAQIAAANSGITSTKVSTYDDYATTIAGKQAMITDSNKLDASLVSGLATVATTGSYNDLSDQPDIPAAITNYVTTDTSQTISGTKTFGSKLWLTTEDSTPLDITFQYACSMVKFPVTVTLKPQTVSDDTGSYTLTLPAKNGTLATTADITDTGATSITTSGNGNAVTTAEYDSSTRKITLRKDTTFLTSAKSLNTENSSGFDVSSGETLSGSGTINLHKIAKTGSYNDLLNKPTIPSTTNFVTIADTQTISGVKTFTAESSFTGETKFTNATYAATWSDIADGIGKSSLFTRAACMQMITGQILAPNKAYTDSSGGYSTEVNKIKFQKMTASNGQPVVTDLAVISESGMTLGTKTVATTSDLPTFSYSNNVLTITY